MRTIRFRVFDLISKQMISLDDTLCNIPYYEIFCHTPDSRPFQVLQFTGLKDKNGKEIYEGDILEFEPEEWGNSENNRSVVEWNDENACFEANGTTSDWGEWCEVIGNKYQNPELLEKSGEVKP